MAIVVPGLLGAAPVAAQAAPQAISGQLSVVPSEAGGSATPNATHVRAVLTTKTGRVISFADLQPAALIGQQVRVSDRSARPGIQGRAVSSPLATRAAVGSALGPRTVAVIRVVFPDATTPVGDNASVRSAFNGAADSASALLKEQSNGQVSLKGYASSDIDVYGPVTVDFPSTDCATRLNDIATQGALLASKLGYVASRYDHTAFLFTTGNCPATWLGLATMPGKTVWLNGTLQSSAIAHELGHNLGVGHAESLACTDPAGLPVALSTDCTTSEYGDAFDTMSNYQGVLMSSWRRWKLGELPAETAQTVTKGRVTLTDANTPGTGGTRVVLIPRPGIGSGGDGYFALELRGPGTAFDRFGATDPVASGITIRLVKASGSDWSSRLIDTHPGRTVQDAALGAGRSFTDPISGVVITTVSTGGGSAVVEVNGAPLADTIAPVFTSGTILSGSVGSVATITWPAADDETRFSHYEVLRDGQRVATGLVARRFTETLPASMQRASYGVVAVDAAGNRTTLGPETVDLAAPGASPAALTTDQDVDASHNTATNASIVLVAPRFVRHKARLSKASRISVRASGSTKLVVTIDGKRVRSVTTGHSTVALTSSQRRRATIRVVATGGTLKATAKATYLVRGGTLTVK